jgi:hypothetical protein
MVATTQPSGTLDLGILPNLASVPMTVGEFLYFIVVGNGGNACDSTGLDITIKALSVPAADFSLPAISPITMQVGGAAQAVVTVNSINAFDSPVALSVSGAPAGVSTSLAPSSVTPPANGSASSTLTVSLSPLVTPTTFTLTVAGTSGAVNHSSSVSVTVVATSSAILSVVAQILAAGCIDNSGIGSSLAAKLTAAQAEINAGNIQDAIDILMAFINELNAQSGKHVLSTCSIGGATFEPAAVLISDARSLISSLT